MGLCDVVVQNTRYTFIYHIYTYIKVLFVILRFFLSIYDVVRVITNISTQVPSKVQVKYIRYILNIYRQIACPKILDADVNITINLYTIWNILICYTY